MSDLSSMSAAELVAEGLAICDRLDEAIPEGIRQCAELKSAITATALAEQEAAAEVRDSLATEYSQSSAT